MTELQTDADVQKDGRAQRAIEKRRSRRAELLRVSLEVFAKKGYHPTRISDIIQAAGVARGTFYLYFESKSAIFHELLDQLLEQLLGNLVGVKTTPEAKPVEEQILSSIERVLDVMISNRGLTTIVLRAAEGLDESVDTKLRDFYGQIHRWIHKALNKGQTLGIVRALDTQVAAICILGTVKQAAQHVVQEDDPVEARRLAKGLLDYGLRGLLPQSLIES